MKREYVSVLILIGLLVFGYYRYKNQTYEANATKWILGTQVQISAESKNQGIDAIVDGAFVLMQELEKQLSYYDDESETDRINQNVSIDTISPEMYKLLQISKEFYEKTDGLFDPTIAPVLDLWDFGNSVIPKQDSLATALSFVGFDKISFSANSLKKPLQTKFNFGAVAKGFIIDKAIEYLKKNEVSSATVNAGGDIRYFSESNKKIRVGIRHPRKKGNSIIAEVALTNKAIVTSGDYEQYFDLGENRYHHIINPKTGFPAPEMISVTIIADDALTADAVSTAVFLMGPENGIKLIKSIPNLAGMYYYKDQDDQIICVKSKSIKNYLKKEYDE